MASLIEEEYDKFTRERLWKPVYERIRNEASLLYTHSPIRHAKLPENRDRNRYRDVSPYDDSRVKLEGCHNDYINASLVNVPLAKRSYILTQGPLMNTSGHFWLMVWQQNSKGVLMLNKVIEDGRLKCHPYFPIGTPSGGEDSLMYNDVNLRVDFIEHEDNDYYIKRTLRLVDLKTQEEKTVFQFHYVAWPDFGIPTHTDVFLSFLYAVRQSGVIPSTSDRSSIGPPVIHCSAGIGRSGTFCLVDSALVIVEKTRSLQSLDIKSMLLDMRKYRYGLIQTADQLQFSYMAILDGAHAILSNTQSEPEPVEDELEDPYRDDSPLDTDDDDDDDVDDEGAELEATSAEVNGDVVGLDQGEKTPMPPPAPVRTSSLSANDKENSEPNNEEIKTIVEQPTPPAETQEVNNHNNIPDPPKRTSSLQKAASLDQAPPPVPPRPPPNISRQVSAPPAHINNDDKNAETLNDEEGGYVNTSNSHLKRKREERDEKKRKTQEKIDEIKANMESQERRSDYQSWIQSPSFVWIGAIAVVAITIGLAYFH